MVALGLFAPATAQQVKISKLSNASFGSISNFTSDVTKTQNVCAYSSATGGRYNVTATGSGSGGAFTLSGSSGSTLAYEVQWEDSSGQTVGTALTAGVALTGQTTGATASGCGSGPSTTASLTILLRTSTITSANATSYSGTLTLMLAPE